MATRESFPSGPTKVPITVEVEAPPSPGTYPAVIVVYGTEGLNEPFGSLIRSFAKELAAAGFVAFIPHYLERTSTSPGTPTVWEALNSSQGIWVDTLADVVGFADNRMGIKKGKIGIAGFSLGGNLALRLAKLPTVSPKPLALVDYFSPISLANGIGANVDALPFVQIHQGTSDQIVPPEQSADLMRLLVAAGKKRDVDFFYFDYPGEGHPFKGARAIADSNDRTTRFLKAHLG